MDPSDANCEELVELNSNPTLVISTHNLRSEFGKASFHLKRNSANVEIVR